MIDLHCHVLPGIDDGPTTIADSLALARKARDRGIHLIVATSHVSHRYDNDSATISALVDELNTSLKEQCIDVTVRKGAEVAATRAAQLPREELRLLGLGGGPWLLVEPPFVAEVVGLDRLLMALQHDGHRIVLAHPERCPGLHRAPRMVRELDRSGVLMSITAGSLVGRFGADVRRFALALAREGFIHNVASDAHDDARRPPGIADELEQAGLRALAPWLTEEVPAAILAGEDRMPRRPQVTLSHLGGRRRRPWRRNP
jgi:protein-tyrosine phosphatase